jgi:phage gp45-like
MWLSKQMKSPPPTADADLGVTTIAGDSVGVVTRGEVRSLPVYGPGGFVWLPENGAEVLVIKGGPGGEEQCVAGLRQKETPKGMKPGEVYLYGPKNNSIYLKQDGSVEIQGDLRINGAPYSPCDCGEVS